MIRQVFVVGCPRSGTTLVQSILASHPGVISFTESHFFSKGFRRRPWGFYRPTFDLPFILEQFAVENLRHFRRDADSQVRRVIKERGVLRKSRAFVAMLNQAADDKRALAWVEKTPDHLYRIGLIAAAAPEAHFVHVVRRGPDTVASLHKATRAWGKPRGWLHCTGRWYASSAATALAKLRYRNQHVVSYEDLIMAPEVTGRRLLEALGLAWDSQLLNRRHVEAPALIAPGERWKQPATRQEIRPSNGSPRLPWHVRPLLLGSRRLYKAAARNRHD